MWWTLIDEETAETTVKVLNQGEIIEDKFSRQSCPACGKSSPTIFQEGWVCTESACANLSKDHSGKVLQNPTYREQLLSHGFLSTSALKSPSFAPRKQNVDAAHR